MFEWKRADLHMHTRFSGWRSLRLIDAQDCYVPPEAAFDAARARGMDFVCFTDHDTIDGALDFLSRHPEQEPRVIVAEEVETRFPDSDQWIHINVFDIDEAIHRDITRLRSNCFELIAQLQARGLLFALNHPFQSFRSVRSADRHLSAVLAEFPAVEVCNSTSPRSHRGILQAMLLSQGAGAVWLAGSDAHTLARIARVYTSAPGCSKHEFLDNVRRGITAIGGRLPGPAALVRDVYSIVLQYYARLYRRPLPLSRRRCMNLAVSGALLPAVLVGVPAVLTLLQVASQEWIARRATPTRSRHLGSIALPSMPDRACGRPR